MGKPKKKTKEKNKEDISDSESDNDSYGTLSACSGEEEAGERRQTRGSKSAVRSGVKPVHSKKGHNAPVTLESKPAIELQEQIKDVICSKPILDRLVSLIADAILDKVSQDVYAAVNHDLENKQKEICSLQKRIQKLEKELASMAVDQEEQAQYSRRNCLVIYGIAEVSGENTDEVAMNFFKSKLDVDVSSKDIDRSHRLTSKKRSTDESGRHHEPSTPRALIVKFARYNVKQMVYSEKKKLKNSNIYIREHLTVKRQQLMRETLNCPSVAKAWTNDGRIRALTKGHQVVSVRTLSDLERL